MGPKKKEKKDKKKGKGEKEKPRKTLKSEYLAQIAERNAVLAAARKKIQGVEDAYFATEKRYEQTQEDMADIQKYLQHEIEENELEIESYNEKIAVYKNEINKNDKYYNSIISKLETEFEEKEKELQCQIQQHTAKLSAFEEVKQQRDEYLKKKEQMSQKMKEMQERHQRELYAAEKEVIIRQDTMQKDMESNLEELSKAFMQASDIAIGETTNEHIRDNITYGNMFTCTQEIFDNARASYNKVNELEKQYRYNADLLDQQHDMIIEKYVQQVLKIETLIKSHEDLRKKIKMSEKLIRDNRRLQRQIAETECIFKEKMAEYNDMRKELSDKTELYNSVKSDLNTLRKSVVLLEVCLYEAATSVKFGVDIETLVRIPDETGEDAPSEAPKDDKVAEENLREYKYKKRETAIDEVLEILGKGLLTNVEMPSPEPSAELQVGSPEESAASGLEIIKSSLTSNTMVLE